MTHFFSYNVIMLHVMQVLKCVNPSISYSDPKSKCSVSGIAISLNLLLKQMDSIGIEHPTADVVRRRLHRHERAVVGRYKQYFLTGKSKENNQIRSTCKDSSEMQNISSHTQGLGIKACLQLPDW